MKIAISAESTIDLPKELLKKYDINVIPFLVLLDGKERLDGDILPQEIFDYVDKNKKLPKTTAINEFQYEEYFKSLLDKGYDAVIHFGLSSEISSTYSNSVQAANQLKNCYSVDSKSLSTGIALLAIYARKLANDGVAPEEIVKKCNERVKKLQVSFVLNTVDYLYHGGRCSAVKKFGVNLLRLKPQIIVEDGKMTSAKVYRGKNEMVIENYCKDVLDDFDNPDLSIAFVTYSSASPEMVKAARKSLEKAGFKTIYETTAGSTISSHCGPKCLGILYLNDGNNH